MDYATKYESSRPSPFRLQPVERMPVAYYPAKFGFDANAQFLEPAQPLPPTHNNMFTQWRMGALHALQLERLPWFKFNCPSL